MNSRSENLENGYSSESWSLRSVVASMMRAMAQVHISQDSIHMTLGWVVWLHRLAYIFAWDSSRQYAKPMGRIRIRLPLPEQCSPPKLLRIRWRASSGLCWLNISNAHLTVPPMSKQLSTAERKPSLYQRWYCSSWWTSSNPPINLDSGVSLYVESEWARQSIIDVSSVQTPGGRLKVLFGNMVVINGKDPRFWNSCGAPRASIQAVAAMERRIFVATEAGVGSCDRRECDSDIGEVGAAPVARSDAAFLPFVQKFKGMVVWMRVRIRKRIGCPTYLLIYNNFQPSTRLT